MARDYEPVIGLEIHAELQTISKMFCGCVVVDPTEAAPNSAVCPVCAGMPGVLPVVNAKAVEYAVRVALALSCEISHTSIFARKNYFYPDLPKGYQISQYESPLARHGHLVVLTSAGEKVIRIRRVHLEEDTGKLTHVNDDGEAYSLVDLNRAGIPLLEIVTEPDMHSPEEVRAYAEALRSVLRYLGVNSGDMQKGVMRIEPNISVRPRGSDVLGTSNPVSKFSSRLSVGMMSTRLPLLSVSRKRRMIIATSQSPTCLPLWSSRAGWSIFEAACRSCPTPSSTVLRSNTVFLHRTRLCWWMSWLWPIILKPPSRQMGYLRALWLTG